MNQPKRRIAILIEIPDRQHGLSALRIFLKGLLRSFGIRCISVLPPSETRTFGSYSDQGAKKEQGATINDQSSIIRPGEEIAAEATSEGLVQPTKPKQKRFPNPNRSDPI